MAIRNSRDIGTFNRYRDKGSLKVYRRCINLEFKLGEAVEALNNIDSNKRPFRPRTSYALFMCTIQSVQQSFNVDQSILGFQQFRNIYEPPFVAFNSCFGPA